MIKVDCNSCSEKPCCRYHGWKVFFLEEERQNVAEKYGTAQSQLITQYHSRSNGQSVYAVDPPCPFFEEVTGHCKIYEARPFICRAELINPALVFICGGRAGDSPRLKWSEWGSPPGQGGAPEADTI